MPAEMGEGMAGKRVLIITNERVADPAGVPEVIAKQVREADALVLFPADALIIGVHTTDEANWRERGFSAKVRERFGLPVTEVMLDREGRVLSVTAESPTG
jgi:hypothetical protein